MKILKFIIKIFYHPFTYNQGDFKIKIVDSWFSNGYIGFKYTANGGFSWRYINYANKPFLLDYNWEWDNLVYKIHPSSTFEDEFKKFSTYQKILDFEKEEYKRYVEGQKDIERQRKNIEEHRINQVKEINKKYTKTK